MLSHKAMERRSVSAGAMLVEKAYETETETKTKWKVGALIIVFATKYFAQGYIFLLPRTQFTSPRTLAQA
jgi:hypothetical protein